jgi:hypothetical protein
MLSGSSTDFALSRENAVRESRAQHNCAVNIQARLAPTLRKSRKYLCSAQSGRYEFARSRRAVVAARPVGRRRSCGRPDECVRGTAIARRHRRRPLLRRHWDRAARAGARTKAVAPTPARQTLGSGRVEASTVRRWRLLLLAEQEHTALRESLLVVVRSGHLSWRPSPARR